MELYELHGQVGDGGTSNVYKAICRKNQCTVVIKHVLEVMKNLAVHEISVLKKLRYDRYVTHLLDYHYLGIEGHLLIFEHERDVQDLQYYIEEKCVL